VVPRGPVMGCHVAPLYWLLVCYVKFYGSVGVEPRPPPTVKGLTKSARPTRHTMFLIYNMVFYLFEFTLCIFGGGSGWGLAPTRGHMFIVHMTIPCLKWHARRGFSNIGPRLYCILHMTILFIKWRAFGFLPFSRGFMCTFHMTTLVNGARGF
jgi:hypothetical protein